MAAGCAAVARNHDHPRAVSVSEERLLSVHERTPDVQEPVARPGWPRWLKIVVWLVGLLTLATVAFVGYVFYVYVTLLRDISPPPLAFDSAAWIAATASTDKTRYRMHKDFLSKHPPVGKTRAEVEKLLGPPAQTGYFREWDMVYPMGPEPGFGVDSVWLVFRLQDGRVVEHNVVTD